MKTLILIIIGVFSLGCSSTKSHIENTSEAMVAGVKHFEGFFSRPYRCPGGIRTIGYGLTGQVAKRKNITETEADRLLRQELARCKALVERVVVVPLQPYQLDSLTSFTFNCGEGSLTQLVSGPGRLNDGNYRSIERILPLYRKARGRILLGLERRRAWEVELWRGYVSG